MRLAPLNIAKYLLGPRVALALLARRIVAVLALLALTGCGGTIYRPAAAGSELRDALDKLNAGRQVQGLPVTDTLLKFIPLGTPEKQAVDLISQAGIPLRVQAATSPVDLRCPVEQDNPRPRPCPDPAGKSDYYLFFSIIAEQRIIVWTTYEVQLGIRGGVVDFVFGIIVTEAF